MRIALAFYKGKGNCIDWCIRTATRSEYSHVELFDEQLYLGQELCFSSSSRDGGVRAKKIKLKPQYWDILYVDFAPAFDPLIFNKTIGAKYDYVGILFSQFLISEVTASSAGFVPNYAPQCLG